MKTDLKNICKTLLFVLFAFVVSSSLSAQKMPHKSNGGGARKTASASHAVSKSKPSKTSGKQTVNNKRISNVRNSNDSHKNINSGNRQDNSIHTGGHNNVNVNVHNDVNVNVHGNGGRYDNHYYHHNHHCYPRPIPSPHPPYVWGGFHITFFNPYFYFPFQPYYWGGWYPWGHLVTSIIETAIIVDAINDAGEKEEYSYDSGTFYLKTDDGFISVAPPIGAVVPSLPKGAEVVSDGKNTYYYYGATFYKKKSNSYEVVFPAAGTVVSHLPEGAEEVKIGDKTFVIFDEIYYQPVQVNGKHCYEIVEVEKD